MLRTGISMRRIGAGWARLSNLPLMIWGITCQICSMGMGVQGVFRHRHIRVADVDIEILFWRLF